MRVLFVVPWFHTNLHHALRGLLARGVEPLLLVHTGGRGGIDGVEIIEREHLPLSEAARLLRTIDPSVIVIRKTLGLARPIYLAARLQSRATLGYDLRPYLMPRGPLARWEGLWKGRPAFRITPVHGLPGPGRRPDPHAAYLPFPVAHCGPAAERVWAPGGIIRFLCVGKLAEARKNQPALLAALERLAGEANFTLTLAGSTSLAIGNPDPAQLAWLRAYPEAGALGARVRLREDVPYTDMQRLYAEHDVCVLPARREPLGIAPVEAMGQGCAALVSSECGSAWYVESGRREGLPCGDLFDPADPEALTTALRRLVVHPETLPVLGRNALAWTEQAFSEEAFAQGFLRLAARLCVRPNPD